MHRRVRVLPVLFLVLCLAGAGTAQTADKPGAAQAAHPAGTDQRADKEEAAVRSETAGTSALPDSSDGSETASEVLPEKDALSDQHAEGVTEHGGQPDAHASPDASETVDSDATNAASDGSGSGKADEAAADGSDSDTSGDIFAEPLTEDHSGGGQEPAVRNHTGAKELSAKDAGKRAQISRRFEGGVAAIADSAATRSFFAAGKDGFITRYLYDTLKPETWQVSTMPIKRIAVHPKKAYIAVYETDGFSVHKIALWDWQAKKQLYAKRFTSSILSLSWSAQGSYLFIGTASTDGITILDVKGNIKQVYPRPPGIVLLAATGPSEKSIVTYGETGRLVYADIAKKSILTQYDTEDRLESPELIKNYTHIIGYKNGNVVVVKAVSGEVQDYYPARSALFAGKITDSLPVWIEKGEDRNTWYLCQGARKSPAFSLPHAAEITAARHVDAAIVIGAADGRLYRLTQGSDAVIALAELNPDAGFPVRDICIRDSLVYMLSDTALYVSRSPDARPEPVIENISADRCTAFGNGFLFWSNTKAAPLYYAEEGSAPEIRYRFREPLNSLSVYRDSIAAVQAFSGLVLLGGASGKPSFTYQAAGLQDAVQVDDTFVLLTKSAGGVIRQPLLLINIKTGETIPLNMEGDLAFSLRANAKMPHVFSCFRLKSEDSEQTDLMTITLDLTNPARTGFTVALSYRDEDLHASLFDDGQAALTNLGKNQLVYYDKARRSIRQLKRDYALSRKALMTDTYIISLNYDGSLSWFNRRTMQLVPHQPLAG